VLHLPDIRMAIGMVWGLNIRTALWRTHPRGWMAMEGGWPRIGIPDL
jgi:hypothetical protein